MIRGCCTIFIALIAVIVGLFASGNLAPVVRKGMLFAKPDLAGIVPAILTEEQKGKFSYDQLSGDSLKGKVAVVTGGNNGLGYSNVKQLYAKGATVFFTSRTEKKGSDTVKMIQKEVTSKHGKMIPMTLELTSLKSVEKFTTELKKQTKRLDTLILNAGLGRLVMAFTGNGIEEMFQVNHISQFKLFKDIEPLLDETAKKFEKPRVVVVTSSGAWDTVAEGIHLNLEDLNSPENFDGLKYYGQSKLANILFARELAKRKSNLVATSVHPGFVNTNFTAGLKEDIREVGKRHKMEWAGEWVATLLDTLSDSISWTMDGGALTQFWAGTVAPESSSGKHYHPLAQEVAPPSKFLNLQEGLWKFSEEILKEKGF